MTMTLVSTVTVGAGGAATIEFTGIPQTGQDLLVAFSVRVGFASFQYSANLTINNSASSYSSHLLLGTGSSVSSATGVATYIAVPFNATSATANTFGNTTIYIPTYASVGIKSLSLDAATENSTSAAYTQIAAASWGTAGSAAVTSLKVTSLDGNFDQYSTASLYTIATTGASGATVA